jgi:hypothetical protein
MDMQTIFQATIPEPFRILGLRLKPLSLGRYRLLNRFNCAFVAEGPATAGIDDLLLGVLICSMGCNEFLEFYQSKSFAREIRKWSHRIVPHSWIGALPWIGKWWRGRTGFNVLEKIALFQRYIKEGSEVPKYFDESERETQSGAHWSHALEVTLRAELGWTADEVNEAPLVKALADYFKYAENQGSVRIMTPEDIEQGEKNAEIYRRLSMA